VTGEQIVAFGEAVEVPVRGGDIAERDERARRLLDQPDNWLPADDEAEALAERMVQAPTNAELEAVTAAEAAAERASALDPDEPGPDATALEPSPMRRRKTEQTDPGPAAPGTGD